MLTFAQFIALYSEFSRFQESEYNAIHAEQLLKLSDSLGNRANEVLGLRIADRLARHAKSRDAKLVDARGETPYSKILHRTLSSHAFCRSRIG